MDKNTRELAVTSLGRGGLLGGSNIIIWILVFLVICGCNGNNFGNLGFGNFLGGGNCGCEKRHHHRHCRKDNNNFFGGNGFFIIIIIAILVLVADGNNNTNIINVDRDTEEGIDD